VKYLTIWQWAGGEVLETDAKPEPFNTIANLAQSTLAISPKPLEWQLSGKGIQPDALRSTKCHVVYTVVSEGSPRVTDIGG